MRFDLIIRQLGVVILTGLLVATSGCATNGPVDDRDPIEGFNRAMHGFNDTFDGVIGKPLATGYKKIIPVPVNKGITNFFNNINDIVVIVNELLQAKITNAVSDLGRVLVNSTIGILGIMDIASTMGMEKHDEDFGQTLGYWGVGPGPYLVIPFLGPSTLRDAAGLFPDNYLDPLFRINHIPTRNALLALKALDKRSDLLSATNIVETAALDQYSFIRDAYLQRREYLVYDGNPPDDEFEEDPSE
ncbi:MAG: VacJ family lipoprotein [Gammaproteobacteria bacterium]|nr:VacJ family lipoprotein [Gammaproteobacteria bacterium]